MDKTNLAELTKPELLEISGGNRFKRIIKGGRWLLEVAGAIDAYNDFIDGWTDCAPLPPQCT
jgi:hypothetical protein